MKNIRLGDLLIELGYITPDQLTAALAYQKEHRDLRVGQALQELGYVNERQVLEALATDRDNSFATMLHREHTAAIEALRGVLESAGSAGGARIEPRWY